MTDKRLGWGFVGTGKLDLTIPMFMKLDHDAEARKLVIGIEDRAVKQQKAMWGACLPLLAFFLPTSVRYIC